MTLTFFLERRHPNGKKMYLYFGELPHIPEGLREVIEEMFTEPNGEEGLRLAQQGRKILEKVLIERGLIPKESDQYWLSYQPKHEVRFSMIPL